MLPGLLLLWLDPFLVLATNLFCVLHTPKHQVQGVKCDGYTTSKTMHGAVCLALSACTHVLEWGCDVHSCFCICTVPITCIPAPMGQVKAHQQLLVELVGSL